MAAGPIHNRSACHGRRAGQKGGRGDARDGIFIRLRRCAAVRIIRRRSLPKVSARMLVVWEFWLLDEANWPSF